MCIRDSIETSVLPAGHHYIPVELDEVVFFCLLYTSAPAALGIAKSPFGRNITAPHQLAEPVHNIGQALALNDVEIVIFLGHRDPQGIQVGVAAVKVTLPG